MPSAADASEVLPQSRRNRASRYERLKKGSTPFWGSAGMEQKRLATLITSTTAGAIPAPATAVTPRVRAEPHKLGGEGSIPSAATNAPSDGRALVLQAGCSRFDPVAGYRRVRAVRAATLIRPPTRSDSERAD